MAKLTRDELKSIWKNGYRPDEYDYIDLFDSFLNLIDDGFILYNLYFKSTYTELEIYTDAAITIKEIESNKANQIQYSIDNGNNWITYSGQFNRPANTSTRFRVTSFYSGYSEGTILIKAVRQ